MRLEIEVQKLLINFGRNDVIIYTDGLCFMEGGHNVNSQLNFEDSSLLQSRVANMQLLPSVALEAVIEALC